MKYKKYNAVIMLYAVLSGYCMGAQNFVVRKKDPLKQSMNKLKEQYAEEIARAVKLIPSLQKQLASLQEQLIDELYRLFEDDIDATKKELDKRIGCVQELRTYLEQDVQSCLPSKCSFLKPAVSACRKISAADSNDAKYLGVSDH
jgi:DNA repair exonuclease SbcCD ATPase subunit